MYKRDKLKINVFYNDSEVSILEILKSDFKEFLEQYLKDKVL